ncbi:MAG: MFS transporter [Thermomicrobiales bacterium]
MQHTSSTSPTDVPGYRALLAEPGVLGFFLAGCIGRIPLAMRAMGCILLVQLITGSYAMAGLVGAVETLVGAVAAPRIGRIADRYGERTILIWGTLVQAVGIIGLVLSAHFGAHIVLMSVSAAMVGSSSVPFGSLSRARWTNLLGTGPTLERAYSMESMADEMGFVIGPLLVVPLCVEVDPAAGILVAMLFSIAAALMMMRQPGIQGHGGKEVRLSPTHASSDKHGSVIAIPGVRVVVAILFAVGFVFGAVDIMIVAFAREHGSPGATSVLAALFAFGSFIGAALYGVINWKSTVDQRFKIAIWWLALGTIPVVLANSLVFMGVAGIFIGLSISPALIAAKTVIEHLSPRAALTEAFAWLGSALATGAALGSMISGYFLDHISLRAGQSLGLIGGIGAAVAVAIWAPYLRPKPREELEEPSGDPSVVKLT